MNLTTPTSRHLLLGQKLAFCTLEMTMGRTLFVHFLLSHWKHFSKLGSLLTRGFGRTLIWVLSIQTPADCFVLPLVLCRGLTLRREVDEVKFFHRHLNSVRHGDVASAPS